MKVHIEPIAACLRVWSKADSVYGDRYDWSATCRWIDSETMEVIGVDKPVTRAMCHAIRDEAWKLGVKKVGFTRIRNGSKRRFWIVTTDGKDWSVVTERP